MALGTDDLKRALDALAVLGTLDAAAEAAGCGREELMRVLRKLADGDDTAPAAAPEEPGRSAGSTASAARSVPRAHGVLGVGPSPVSVHVDAGSRGNPGPSACAFVATAGGVKTVRGRYLGVRTNNEAEYEGLLDALRWIEAEGRSGARIHMDSRLVVMQVTGRWRVKEPRLKNLVAEARRLLAATRSTLHHVPRGRNSDADREVNRVLDLEERGRG